MFSKSSLNYAFRSSWSQRFHILADVVTLCTLINVICRPDVSELETKLSEQAKILSNLQQKVDDLAAKVRFGCSISKFFVLAVNGMTP